MREMKRSVFLGRHVIAGDAAALGTSVAHRPAQSMSVTRRLPSMRRATRCSEYCGTPILLFVSSIGRASQGRLTRPTTKQCFKNKVDETLNMPSESLKLVHPDSDVTPHDVGPLGSRSLFNMRRLSRRPQDSCFPRPVGGKSALRLRSIEWALQR